MKDASGKEVLIEIYQVGNSVKVSAVDPETGVEVSIVGSPTAGEEILKWTAINKRKFVLRKRQESGSS